MPYSTQHLSPVLFRRNFLSIPLLNFLSPCLFAKLTIMKITDLCSHPFYCVIHLNYVFDCLKSAVVCLWNCHFYLYFENFYWFMNTTSNHSKVTVIVNSNNKYNNHNNCTCLMYIHQTVSRAVHVKKRELEHNGRKVYWSRWCQMPLTRGNKTGVVNLSVRAHQTCGRTFLSEPRKLALLITQQIAWQHCNNREKRKMKMHYPSQEIFQTITWKWIYGGSKGIHAHFPCFCPYFFNLESGQLKPSSVALFFAMKSVRQLVEQGAE